MAAPWRLERGTHFPIGRTNETQQVKASGNPVREGISVRQDDLLLRHRLHHAHRALAGTSVLALVLVALALTYLMVTCMRHLSKGFRFSNQQSRHLASNYPDEDDGACQGPPGHEEQDQGAGAAEGAGVAPEGAAAPALPGGLGAPHGPAPAVPAGQTRRVLPPQIEDRVGRTLLLLQQPVEALTPLIPSMRPDHCLAIVRTLCRLAALELSGFATVPPCLQPLRQHVAHVYDSLIQRVLTTEELADEAARHDWYSNLRSMQVLLRRLARTPSETERIAPHHYRMTMENHQRACHWMLSQLLKILGTIDDIREQDTSAKGDEAIFQQRGVLVSLFVARRQQILRCITLRHWLVLQHNRFDSSVMYDDVILDQARNAPPDVLSQRLNALFAAVVDAGGEPATQFHPLPPLPEDLQQQQQQQPQSDHLEHGQQPGPPHAHPPQAHGPAPVLFAPPPAQHAHPPVQPIPQAPIMPQPPQPAQGAAHAQVAFDSAAQDALFPAINPDPHIAGQQQPAIPIPPIHLPPIYHYWYVFPLQPDEPSTPSSAGALSGMELGAFSAPSQPSSTSGQLQTPHTGTNQDSSSDDDDA
ncbi:hypothetical protein Emed_005584 [Eimeria media]